LFGEESRKEQPQEHRPRGGKQECLCHWFGRIGVVMDRGIVDEHIMRAFSVRNGYRYGFLVLVMMGMATWVPVRGQDEHTITLRGQVLNSVTKEPVAHALVTVMGDQYAMFSDDQGRYEFALQSAGAPGGVAGSGGGPGGGLIFVNRMVTARKPGYLDSNRTASAMRGFRSTQETQSDVTIYLVPEALIVGHVEVPGSEGEVRIECELYRKEMREGRQVWSAAGTFTTWGNGEFRFSQLRAGTYKLITHEQMDRDSLAQVPGGPLFGYPPVYYPNTTDFSTAGEIAVKAGQTAQVNLSVARQEYFPVRLGTRYAPVGQPIGVSIWPMGHWGPGWSLGYNPADQSIEGMLPNGNYTVEGNSFGEQASTGIANFSVRGRPVEGPGVQFVANASIGVTVRQEFHGEQSVNDGSEGVNARGSAKRAANLHILLRSLEESSNPSQNAQARVVGGSGGLEYTFPSVRPGRYEVHVTVAGAYVSAMESGGKDLTREPLVVPLGGSVPPIEITMRDDGAEVDGTVQDSAGEGNSQGNQESEALRIIYLVPVGGGQPRLSGSQPNGNFTFTQVAPGDYVLLAFDEQQENVESVNEPLSPELQSKGQVVHLEAGQKASVTLQVIEGSAE